ncbi:Choline/ethanolaminephosphotransferase [Basidiobolus meristosporus CBS 931.73]|uniref:Choline/ethanolaminephosphotransferase n=1 Tax=Basidiobolus meristosporus CBS 931.73 TaxID=1314790 RepID=A0A1Y1YFU7_9FUNG|nr:Choline/ethanolaminephosphotransferase [Basidiobolus meristosporus CBS 931.73]|eukprot:ORX96484.1 Choline/ethanolaminephosphotransferase [Basidiobolus meristosporus CBS 931.73]
MTYIQQKYLSNLSKYKYSGVDKSLLSKYVLQHYWSALVKLFPLWMAPNLITLIGFLCVVVNFFTVIILDPTLSEPVPGWVYVSYAVGLWVYASLDAIDGKQARRTGTSGPLGEMFDHGRCDALNTAFGTVICSSVLGVGQSWWTLVSFLAATSNFYLSTWEEYHTGTLYLGYFSGPVEGIVLLVGLFGLTGFVEGGSSFWKRSLRQLLGLAPGSLTWIPDFPTNQAFNLLSLVVLGANVLSSIVTVIKTSKKNNQSPAKALLGLLPFAGSVGLVYAWLNASPSIVTEHLTPFMIYCGCSFGYMVGRMILAHVTKAPFPYFHRIFIPLILGALNASLPAYFNREPILPLKYEFAYIIVALVYSIAAYAHFALAVIADVCAFFDIWCLRIKHPKKTE